MPSHGKRRLSDVTAAKQKALGAGNFKGLWISSPLVMADEVVSQLLYAIPANQVSRTTPAPVNDPALPS